MKCISTIYLGHISEVLHKCLYIMFSPTTFSSSPHSHSISPGAVGSPPSLILSLPYFLHQRQEHMNDIKWIYNKFHIYSPVFKKAIAISLIMDLFISIMQSLYFPGNPVLCVCVCVFKVEQEHRYWRNNLRAIFNSFLPPTQVSQNIQLTFHRNNHSFYIQSLLHYVPYYK